MVNSLVRSFPVCPHPPLWPLVLLGHSVPVSGLCTCCPLHHPMVWLAPSLTQFCSSEKFRRYILPKVPVPLHHTYLPLFCYMVFITTKHCTPCLFICLCFICLSHKNASSMEIRVLFRVLLCTQYLTQSLHTLWVSSQKHISLCFCV